MANLQKYTELINNYLDEIIPEWLIKFLKDTLPRISNNWWEAMVIGKFKEGEITKTRIIRESINSLDGFALDELLKIFEFNWNDISQKCNLLPKDRNTLFTMKQVRNDWSHITSKGYDLNDTYRDFDTIERFLKMINADQKTIEEIQKIRQNIMKDMKDIFSPQEDQDSKQIQGNSNKPDKKEEFSKLCSEVEKCEKCQRFKKRQKCLSDKNGNLDATVLFIALAPAKGAKATGCPLKGDTVGNNFDSLLNYIHWGDRKNIFVTNAILCNVIKDEKDEGENEPKSDEKKKYEYIEVKPDEIKNCNEYLERTIEIIDPKVVITLGEKALNALKLIEGHNYSLINNAADTELIWNRRRLFPLYLMTEGIITQGIRTMEQQVEDFEKLKSIVDSLGRNSEPIRIFV
jgi:DNA polymerase